MPRPIKAFHERMRCNVTRAQRVREFRIPRTQAIDPNRGIGHAHVAGSLHRGAPPVDFLQWFLAAAQERKTAGALALDQRIERFPQYGTAFRDAAQALRALQQGSVQTDRSAHVGYSSFDLVPGQGAGQVSASINRSII
jgi:hypothetical protein